jgi:ABC-type Fe3+/spermidine/putrescine transport system ATPase subunit
MLGRYDDPARWRPDVARGQAVSAAASGAPLVRLRGLAKSFGPVVAVRPLDLEIQRGDFFAILGPSGCGKTTLLRMIGGFETPTSGTLEIGGQDMTRLGPERRPTNMVFQGYGLFPHMNVRQNIAYGLRLARVPAAELTARVRQVIELVRLEELTERPVQNLSGGQQQRVALARALVMRPQVLLLDEPLGALDLKLRKAMQEELRRIHHSIGGTFVFVTHDQEEALGLANRIAVMEAGVLVQEGSAEEIYGAPRTRFVSTFIGEANVLAGRRDAGMVTLDHGPSFVALGRDGKVTLVVRPEAVRLAEPAAGELGLSGVLEDRIFFGAYVRYRVVLADGTAVTVHRSDPPQHQGPAIGAPIALSWSLADARCLDDE